MNQKLIDFVTKHTHLKAEEIKPELRLAADIGFYGLDAVIFFESFFSEFEIMETENFDFRLHIDGGPDFIRQPLVWLKNIIITERRKYLRPDVTLGHLNSVLENGIWFNER